MKNLRDLLEHEVQDLYSAETQLIEALPKMAKAVENDALRKLIEKHLKETTRQKERLEKVAELLDISPKGEKCKGMEGLIKEGEKVMKEKMDAAVKDAAITGAAQRVEHYEIAGYGTACTFAKMLGEEKVKNLLGESLDEEKNADEKLTKVALETVNAEATNS